MRIWTFVDRNRVKIIDFEIGDGSINTFLKLYNRITKSKEVELFCTDKKKVYANSNNKTKAHHVKI